MASPDTQRLGQIVEVLSRINHLLDGGYQYSSPIVRERYHQGKTTLDAPVVHHAGLLDLLNEIGRDLNWLGEELRLCQDQATLLGIDTVALCGADLPVLRRAVDGLCVDVISALGRAHEIIDPPKAERPERPKRTRTKALASSPPPDGQSGLFTSGDAEAVTSEDQL